jgi:hypothetical protein
VLGLLLLVDVGRADAVCLGESLEEDIARAEVVFVGRAVTISDGGATVKVRVEQVWKGGPVSDRVTVHYVGTLYPVSETGTRYLFAPRRQNGRLIDDHCSATRVYSAEVAKLVPDTVTLPRRSASGSSGVAVQAAIALVLVVIGVIVSVIASRRRRRGRPAPVSPS